MIAVALCVLFIDQSQTPASFEERIDLAGATEIFMELDHCELIYIQEPPRETNVRFFDERISAEQYLLVHIKMHDDIKIVQEITNDATSFSIRIDNAVQPQYARYEDFLCVYEYHYPKEEVIPATTITLAGRHASTITAGRCEVCYLSTRSDMVSTQAIGRSAGRDFEILSDRIRVS